MSFLRRVVPLLLAVSAGACLAQATPSASPSQKTDAEIKAEDAQANAFLEKQDFVDAYPLYQELYRLRPSSLVYEERLAFCLLGAAKPGDVAARQQAKALLLDAQKKGDNSNLLQTLLEKIEQSGTAPAEHPAGYEFFERAEAAFAKGDLPGAVTLYAKALEVNPQYYAAATFAGDAEFKQHHFAEASSWFAKAVAIDPDTETAHRYWGDSLEMSGEHTLARDQFIQAVIADPYSRAPRLGLKQWADKNHRMLAAPPIQLPQRATKSADGKININVAPSAEKNDPNMSIGLMYQITTASWQGDEFHKHFPNEKQYRHSLLEETTAIRMMLTVASEQKLADDKLSPSLRLLKELDSKGLLEAWVLLDHPDQGIAQDYIAYRKEHRDKLAQYIAQYDLHPM